MLNSSNKLNNNQPVILSIDPGYDRLGVAVLTQEATGTRKPLLLYSDCIQTDKKQTHARRLVTVGKAIAQIIEDWQPTELALEDLFFSKNQTTGLLVSQAIGVMLYEAAQMNIPVFQYKPVEVKVAVTGYGKSDKEQVTQMLPRLVKIAPKPQKTKRLDDEFDAIAIGLTHLACRLHTRK